MRETKNPSPPTSMLKGSKGIDRQHVAEAVLEAHESFLDFSNTSVEEISIPFIKLEGIGKMKIPLSLMDAGRLKDKLKKKKTTTFLSPPLPPLEKKITALIIKQLGLQPFTKMMDFQAHLEKLMLYEVDGEEHSLPVTGGHDGGNIHVKYKEKKMIFENQLDCDQQKQVLSSFYNSCEYIMNPVTRGWKLTLVFNLVWTNSNIVIPADFLVFLTSKKMLESAISPWIPEENKDDYHPLVQLPLIDEEKNPVIPKAACCMGPPSVIEYHSDDSFIQDSDDSEIEDSVDYEEESDLSDFDNDKYFSDKQNSCSCDYNSPIMMAEEDVLFFVLEDKYFESSLQFHQLRGSDRNLADLLRCCSFIEVHLSIITSTNTKKEKYGDISCSSTKKVSEQTSTKISRWTDSDSVVKYLNIDELNWNDKCVGPLRNLLDPSKIKSDKENKFNKLIGVHTSYCDSGGGYCHEDRIKIHQRIYFHAILIIWPKNQSIGIYCRYGLNSLLNSLESPLTSASGWQTRQQIAQDLHKAVKYCCTYPQRIWTQSAFRNGELTLRFLRLCIALRAHKEGLKILKKIGSEFDTEIELIETKKNRTTKKKIITITKINKIYYEGIQNEQVAEAVVKFVCQSNCLSDCIDLIKGLITAHWITKQFVPIIKLIQYFLIVKCVKGAALVGDCVASSIVRIDQNGAAGLELSDLDVCMDAIVSLEMFPEASSQERMASLVSLFSKLHSTLQCRLLLKLDAQGISRFMGFGHCQFIFMEICKTFLSCELSFPSAKDALELLKCFIRLGNSEWLETLISKMTSVPHQIHLVVLKNAFLKQLISTQDLWDLAKSSELGKTSVISILRGYSTMLFKQLSTVNPKAQSETLSNLTVLLGFVMKMERNSEISDPQMISSVSLQLSQMNFEQLYHIFDGFHKSNSQRLKIPCYSNMMREICMSLVSELKKSNVMQRREAISNMVWRFNQFPDESLAQSLIMEVITIEADGCWSFDFKYQFFNDLISSSDWRKLQSIFKLQILHACAKLIDRRVIEECTTLDGNTQIPPNKDDFLKSKMSNCVHFFFLIEQHRFDLQESVGSFKSCFQPYFQKLPLICLLWLILDLHVSVVTRKPCIKKFPVCLELFIAACRLFSQQNFLSLYFSEEQAGKFVNCLLWIDDGLVWKLFGDKMCSSLFTEDSFDRQHEPFQQIFLLPNPNIQEMIVNSQLSFDAFIRIIDFWVSKWKSVKEPPFTNCMPKAQVPNHPEVETFLRSSQKDFVYRIEKQDHVSFKKLLEDLNQNPILYEFSFSVNNCVDNVHYTLEKTKEHHDRVILEPFRRLATKIQDAQKIRQSASQKRCVAVMHTKQKLLEPSSPLTTSDEVLIFSPPKRSKPDILIVDLTI